MKALTFVVRFETAQFKLHHQKLARRTYLIPPPSAVAGLFGAILGVPREELKKFCEEKRVLAGAELRSLGGHYVTISRIFKFDRKRRAIMSLLKNYWEGAKRAYEGKKYRRAYKEMDELRPLKESEELFRPEYKLAIAAEDEVVEEGLRRLRELDFEYEIFGGNDYHFVDYVGDAREARLVKSREGAGYCPSERVREVRVQERRLGTMHGTRRLVEGRGERVPMLVISPVGPALEDFVFAYRAIIVADTEMDAVQDEESTIFVFDPVRYLVP